MQHWHHPTAEKLRLALAILVQANHYQGVEITDLTKSTALEAAEETHLTEPQIRSRSTGVTQHPWETHRNHKCPGMVEGRGDSGGGSGETHRRGPVASLPQETQTLALDQ